MTRTRLSLAALCVAVVSALLAACGSTSTTSPPPTPSSSAATARCGYTPGGEAAKKVALPPSDPTVSGTVPVTIHSSVGALHLSLDATKAPCTVNSFVSLARQGFYDGSHCRRLGDSPGFHLLQCGDPTGTGTGGPGYTIPDELSGSETYPAGTLAMANTGAPHSGGSQFFMVFGATSLPPSYTVFGTLAPASVRILRGVAAKGIADPGQDGTGEPKDRVVFEKVSVG